MDKSFQDQFSISLASQLTDWVGVLLTVPFILHDGQFLKPMSIFVVENQLVGGISLTPASSQLAEWVGVLLTAPYTLPDGQLLKPIFTFSSSSESTGRGDNSYIVRQSTGRVGWSAVDSTLYPS